MGRDPKHDDPRARREEERGAGVPKGYREYEKGDLSDGEAPLETQAAECGPVDPAVFVELREHERDADEQSVGSLRGLANLFRHASALGADEKRIAVLVDFVTGPAEAGACILRLEA